jgi:hypothetical protein
VPPLEQAILMNSSSMPEFPPVTTKTLPTREGTTFFSVKVGLGGKNCVITPPMMDWMIEDR